MIRHNFVLERRPLWDRLAELLISTAGLGWDALLPADQEDLRRLAREVRADCRYLQRHFRDDPLVGYLRELGERADGVCGIRARLAGTVLRGLGFTTAWVQRAVAAGRDQLALFPWGQRVAVRPSGALLYPVIRSSPPM